MRTSICQSCRWAGVFFTSMLALTCQAVPIDVHVSGMVPGPATTANDFHLQVTITQPFLLGAPINFVNGPFAGDGVFTSSPSGFSVEWSGAPVTGGGPYDFQFDFTVDQLFTGVAFWTLNGIPVENVPTGVFTFRIAEVAEPSSMGLLLLAGALLLVPRSREGGKAVVRN